jgi:hypothetical protein
MYLQKAKMTISGPGSISQSYGSPDPDPYQNVTDPQHWFGQESSLAFGSESGSTGPIHSGSITLKETKSLIIFHIFQGDPGERTYQQGKSPRYKR